MNNTITKSLVYDSNEAIIKNAPKNSYVVAWLDDSLVIDTFDSVKWPDVFTKIQRVRIFNEKEELHLWRSKGLLRGRLKVDPEDNSEESIDAKQLLWGTTIKEEGDYLQLTEDRGTYLKIPKFFEGEVDPNKRIFIQTRNYIGYTTAHHATFIDCRFVKFVVEN
ncbi:MAG: CRISPR-associated protein Csx19 [Bacteroidetes bacterium]|jgi:CRISPR-associated protein (TIGR03984 family)|nr:CRISPR-associated protein Csx19 [Bacteroidota bacterium]